MKNIINLSVVLVLILMTSCSADRITGSGDLTSDMRNVNNFTKVSSEGVFIVNITQGTSQSVQIIADDNIIQRVKTEVVNGELRLYLDNHSYNNISLEANITVTRLNGLKNNGVGNVYAYNIDETENFKVINFGSADVYIEGNAASLSIYNEGSGSIKSFDFLVNDSNVEIDGSGDVEVNCSDNLDVEIDGSGSVYYKGNPIINDDISGSGQVVNDN